MRRRLTDRMRERRNTWRAQRAALRASRRGPSGYGVYVAATRHVDTASRKGWLATAFAHVVTFAAKFSARHHFANRRSG